MGQAHTKGPWKAKPIGGSSMVVAVTSPAHNQPKTAIGYNEANGYSIGLPFWDDSSGKREVRLDFVEFSHADARLIAAAPTLFEACASVWLMLADTNDNELRLIADECRAALSSARATGGTE